MTFLYWLLIGAFAIDAGIKLEWLGRGHVPDRTTAGLAADVAFNLLVLGLIITVWR